MWHIPMAQEDKRFDQHDGSAESMYTTGQTAAKLTNDIPSDSHRFEGSSNDALTAPELSRSARAAG